MVKKRATLPRKITQPDRFPLIEKELHKRVKADLVAIIMTIAREHPGVARELIDQLNVKVPVELLVVDLASAIDRATDFDERFINTNFEVDWKAYDEVQKGFSHLVQAGRLEDAKSLALKLMEDGSRQVEYSDEGLMTDEICECLKPVIHAVCAAGGSTAAKWAKEMQKADRVGFICDQELVKLCGRSKD
jgi:hypothetical protein